MSEAAGVFHSWHRYLHLSVNVYCCVSFSIYVAAVTTCVATANVHNASSVD